MAHIATCLLDAGTTDDRSSLPDYIVHPASPSPHPPYDLPDKPERPFAWRMHQPERKYQLFPKDKQMPLASGKGLDPEQAFALAMSQNGEKTDKPSVGSGLRLRIKEHNLIRRRKVSVPELGPMTTVQEVAMDSPTIPGRPPLHERSISAPGNSWRPHHLVDFMTQSNPESHDELPEIQQEARSSPSDTSRPPTASTVRQPLSPKTLAPLVIPPQHSPVPRLTRQLSLSRLRSGSTPMELSVRSARTDDSPKARTPFTPLSASTLLTAPMSATTAATSSTLPTPVSAPLEARASPQPWAESNNNVTVSTPIEGSPSTRSTTPKADAEVRSIAPSTLGHRRGQSESGSIMERGRPRKRTENRDFLGHNRSASKASKSAERRAFETLPRGWKASEVTSMLSPTEVSIIQKQALQQASRFEVLRKEDVDSLSRELRVLDERTEYLRRTLTSLRAGRRNLHSRICQYLRSPRTAKFSHDSMLKQEETLAELDVSIDDWVTKLDHAENRRIRVRQKLLEHVAAAAMLATPANGVVGVSETLQLAMGIKSPSSASSTTGAGNISTPPRSPAKSSFSHSFSNSPSPQRVTAHVPSTILEQPLVEEAAALVSNQNSPAPAHATASPPTLSGAGGRRVDVESIRIYAGDDVYALLADVENEITKMSAGDHIVPREGDLTEEERKRLHRAHSQELLLSGSWGAKKSTPPPSPGRDGRDSPTLRESPVTGEVFLTNAVFRPEKSMLAL